MYKVECSRCCNGKGRIAAFSHIQGGVCFKCGGKGYVMRKTKPGKPSVSWQVGATNGRKTHPGDNDVGVVVFPIFTVKAPTQAAALKKAAAILAGGSDYFGETVFVKQVTQ